MPISLPVPQGLEMGLYQLLSEILRRAIDGSMGSISVSGSIVVTGGDVEIATVGRGLILKSANGTRYRLGVDNDGAITTTPL
jgi:hypothetical protein